MNKLNKKVFYKIISRFKRLFLGTHGDDGLILRLFVYFLLISIGFVYLYPFLYMIIDSFKNLDDLLDPTVIWIPTSFHLGNYIKAISVLKYQSTLLQTILIAGLSAIAQTISTAVIGYGFARYNFPGKKLIFGLILATFIIPPQITVIPVYLMFKQYKILGTILPFLIPAGLGQGLRSAIFILIYYQFFRMIPKSLEEAAQIDGAKNLQIFYKIVLPLTIPAIIVVFLFSFVWYWNETYLAALYLGDNITTLPLELQKFADTYSKMYTSVRDVTSMGNSLNESIKLSGMVLTILPLLILYMITQNWFVESSDRAGITGE